MLKVPEKKLLNSKKSDHF